MNRATLESLAQFPAALGRFYAAFPAPYVMWRPESWDGIPSETFTALEQLCHVRDIEIDGYQVRLRRSLSEENPFLPSLDGYALAEERRYAEADAERVLDDIARARRETVRLIEGLDPMALRRKSTFEGYGPVTVAGLVHYLCSHDQQHLSGLQWLLGKIEAERA